MSTDKNQEQTNPRPANQNEKIADLPAAEQTEKDAQSVKGGQRPNILKKG